MTNKEALQEVAQIPLTDAAIEKAFLDNDNILYTDNYSNENEQDIDLIAIKVLSNFLAADISEGGYSISYRNTIEQKISRLKIKWGIDVVADPGVEDVSFLW